MGTPTHFPNGVTNVPIGGPMTGLTVPDPTLYYTFHDDFFNYNASEWIVTEVDTDSDAAVANAITTGAGGWLVLNVEADELDLTQLQWASEESSAVVEHFLMASGKKTFMKARFKVSDATDTGILIGLAVTDTTVVAGATDGFYFRKADTSTSLTCTMEKNSTEVSVTAATMANDTFVTVAVEYDGASTMKVWADGVHVGTSVAVTAPTDEELTVSLGINNGVEGAEALTVDYIFIAQER